MKIPFLYCRSKCNNALSTRGEKLHTLHKERMLSHVKIPKYVISNTQHALRPRKTQVTHPTPFLHLRLLIKHYDLE